MTALHAILAVVALSLGTYMVVRRRPLSERVRRSATLPATFWACFGAMFVLLGLLQLALAAF